MAYSIENLRKLTDEQLIDEHDRKAVHTVVGTQFYMEELDRRSRRRSEKAMLILTLASAITSIAAVIISTIALLK